MMGSSTFITDISGRQVAQHVEYMAFGETFAEENFTRNAPNKFNCEELDDESGLYYYGARYYDPRTSVWLGVDPMSDNAPSISPFTYCMNNPVRLQEGMISHLKQDFRMRRNYLSRVNGDKINTFLAATAYNMHQAGGIRFNRKTC